MLLLQTKCQSAKRQSHCIATPIYISLQHRKQQEIQKNNTKNLKYITSVRVVGINSVKAVGHCIFTAIYFSRSKKKRKKKL